MSKKDLKLAHRQRLCTMLLHSVSDLKHVDKTDAVMLLTAVCQNAAVEDVDKLHYLVSSAIAVHAMFLENLRGAAFIHGPVRTKE